ncbi:DHH family phosphoesterase [Clostridium oceanicum]|uniref:Cyclic-di-AMP phosphodiesterase n=1 Tax=Clostridium oceanicum TaxID=1543 RepID=A0ABP3UZL7_9CLOT
MDNKYDSFITTNKIYMVIIAVFIMILFLYQHIIIGLISIAVYGLLVVYNLRNIKLKKNELKNFIKNFSSKMDTAFKSTLMNSPFPMIVISNDGSILWYNKEFSVILHGKDLLGSNISSEFKKFKFKQAIEGKKNLFKNISFKDRYYDIYSNIIYDEYKENKMLLMYLYDVTNILEIIKTVESKKEGIMLVEVDNLDEVIKGVEEDKKPLLVAEIERNISIFSKDMKAMMKKYQSNKYIISVQNFYIDENMDKKFSILDEIRNIDIGNKMSPTLSIGIGKGGKTPVDNYNYAMAAKELALGRGGDQAVVKNKDKLFFYGGKTKEVEKRTKVRARVIAHALVNLINESSKIFIMGHKNPDIDCIGSATGLHSIISQLNKKCYIILENSNNSTHFLLEKIKEEEDFKDVFINNIESKELIDEDSLLIIVDAHSKGYVQNNDLIERFNRIVIIDHHRRATDCIENPILSYIEPYASSASELVTEMIQYMVEKPKISSIVAEALLAGIYIDTKNFYFKTGVRTFQAASFLKRLGADTIDVKKLFSNDLESYVQKSEIIKSAKVDRDIAIAVCPSNIKSTVLAAQAADELLNIRGIRASFVLVNIENEVYISGRSLGKINVQVIMEMLGGGGHMTIAGSKLTLSTEDTVKKLKDAIDKYLREGE